MLQNAVSVWNILVAGSGTGISVSDAVDSCDIIMNNYVVSVIYERCGVINCFLLWTVLYWCQLCSRVTDVSALFIVCFLSLRRR